MVESPRPAPVNASRSRAVSSGCTGAPPREIERTVLRSRPGSDGCSRSRAPHRDSFPLDQVEHLTGVETALEEDNGVTAERRQQQSLKSTDVEHGTALQDHGAWLVGIELMRQAPGHEQKAVQVGD